MEGRPEEPGPRGTYRRQHHQDYQVWVQERYIGVVWKEHQSRWYCSTGHAGFTN